MCTTNTLNKLSNDKKGVKRKQLNVQQLVTVETGRVETNIYKQYVAFNKYVTSQ